VNPRVLGGEGFEDDAVAEGLELGDGPLTLALGVAPDEVVATKVLIVAVVSEQAPGDHQDRMPDGDSGLLLADPTGQPPVLADK
jgi:hypothetical protein